MPRKRPTRRREPVPDLAKWLVDRVGPYPCGNMEWRRRAGILEELVFFFFLCCRIALDSCGQVVARSQKEIEIQLTYGKQQETTQPTQTTEFSRSLWGRVVGGWELKGVLKIINSIVVRCKEQKLRAFIVEADRRAVK